MGLIVTAPATSPATTSVAGTVTNEFHSSFTGTLTGLTTSPTGAVNYIKVGNMVVMNMPSISATSNATTMTMTGMPTDCRPTNTQVCFGLCIDNGTNDYISKVAIASTGVITFTIYTSLAGPSAFTASGTKGVRSFVMSYCMD